MKTILGSGCEKIMRLFYKDKNAKFHLREIARKTKLNENSATRFLLELEKENILISEREGNMKKFGISRNDMAFALFAVFDVERFGRLPGIRKNAISHFMDQLGEKPVIAVLFGSTAKETYGGESDIDMLLVVNRKTNTENAENYAESQTGMKINLVQITFRAFLNELKVKDDHVIQSALSTGYPLTNHILYYREALK
jgi:predicted nucleotidyltransferase